MDESERDIVKLGNIVAMIVPKYNVMSKVPKFAHWYSLNLVSIRERSTFNDCPFFLEGSRQFELHQNVDYLFILHIKKCICI